MLKVRFKKTIGAFLSLVIAFSFIFPITAFGIAFEPNIELHAKGIYMVNLDTGQVIFEKNKNERIYPASLTKIMTAILAIENIDDLSTEITYKNYIQDMMSTLNAQYGGISLGGLLAGETLSAEKLLYATLLPSANEAATILADYVGKGSVSDFCEMMNKKAKEIGAKDTHFVNPHGLHDEQQYTTPYDMALITQYALKNETFRKICETNFYDGSPTNMHESQLFWNTTNLLSVPNSEYYVKGATGIKTGTLAESGKHVISTAKRGGYEYLLVVMGAPFLDKDGKQLPKNYAFTDSKALYNWAFTTFTNKTVIEKGSIYNEVPVKMSADKANPFIKLRASKDFIALIPKDIDVSSIHLKYNLPESVDAPVKEGDIIGSVDLVLKDEVMGNVPLEASRDINRSFILFIINSITSLLTSFWFKFIFILIIVLILAYIGLALLRYRNHKKYRQIKRHRRL